MATKLNSKIKREISVREIPLPVIVTITPEGIKVTVKGSRKQLEATWDVIIGRMPTPDNIPASFYKRPFEFLQHLANKMMFGWT